MSNYHNSWLVLDCNHGAQGCDDNRGRTEISFRLLRRPCLLEDCIFSLAIKFLDLRCRHPHQFVHVLLLGFIHLGQSEGQQDAYRMMTSVSH